MKLIDTSVNIALYQSLAIFGFVLSIFVLREQIQWLRSIPLVVCIIGVACIAAGSFHTLTDQTARDAIWGLVLVFMSSLLYAVYEVLYIRLLSSADDAFDFDVVLKMQTLIGAVDVILLWPFLLIFHFSGLEPLNKFTGEIALFLAINSGLTVTYFTAMMIALFLTASPNYVNFSSMIALPLSGLFDYLYHHVVFNVVTLIGMVRSKVWYALMFCSLSFLWDVCC